MNFNIEVWLTLLNAFGQSDSRTRVMIGDIMFLLYFIHVQNHKTLHKKKQFDVTVYILWFLLYIDFKNTSLVY